MFKYKQRGEGWYIQILVNYLTLVFLKGHQWAKYLTVHLWVRFPRGGLLNQRVNTCVILLAVVIQLLGCIQLFATPELQHARLLCASLFPRVCLNSCPLSQWCHPTISSSVPFSSCPQSFPASGSFPMSQLFAGGQSFARCCQTPSRFCTILHFYWQWLRV